MEKCKEKLQRKKFVSNSYSSGFMLSTVHDNFFYRIYRCWNQRQNESDYKIFGFGKVCCGVNGANVKFGYKQGFPKLTGASLIARSINDANNTNDLIGKVVLRSEDVQMELSYILCVFVLCVHIFSDFVLISSVAAVPLCPVRAVPVFAPEAEQGYKCVCRRNFYGENCRFKGKIVHDDN